jgi:hypothetical protein
MEREIFTRDATPFKATSSPTLLSPATSPLRAARASSTFTERERLARNTRSPKDATISSRICRVITGCASKALMMTPIRANLVQLPF